MKILTIFFTVLSASTAFASLNGAYNCSGLDFESADPIELELQVSDAGIVTLVEEKNDEGEPVIDRAEFTYGEEATQGWNFITEVIDGEVDNTAYKLVNLGNKALRLYYEGTYDLNGSFPDASISILDFYKVEYEDYYIFKISYSGIEVDLETNDPESTEPGIDTFAGQSVLRCLAK